MLRIYADAIEVIRLLHPILEQVKRNNANLADQCDRVAVALNLSRPAKSGEHATSSKRSCWRESTRTS
jgi:hypothetical protein